jgi:hypothetical protein
MGTNFYKVLKPKYNKKQKAEITKKINEQTKKLKEYFNDNNYIERYDIEDYFEMLNELRPVKVHLGKRSGGWQFLWNHNNEQYYKKTLQSIREFLDEDNGFIVDEYGERFTTEQFLNEEIGEAMYNDPDRFINGPQYDEQGKNIYAWAKCSNYEFTTNEGLRFATSTEFS